MLYFLKKQIDKFFSKKIKLVNCLSGINSFKANIDVWEIWNWQTRCFIFTISIISVGNKLVTFVLKRIGSRCSVLYKQRYEYVFFLYNHHIFRQKAKHLLVYELRSNSLTVCRKIFFSTCMMSINVHYWKYTLSNVKSLPLSVNFSSPTFVKKQFLRHFP